jgi:hypothetical protein
VTGTTRIAYMVRLVRSMINAWPAGKQNSYQVTLVSGGPCK